MWPFSTVLLRNCEPRNVEEYPSKQVLLDSKEFLGWEVGGKQVIGRTVGELVQEGWLADKYSDTEKSEVIDIHNFFTSFMQKLMVDRYSIAIRSIRCGLTLDGELH